MASPLSRYFLPWPFPSRFLCPAMYDVTYPLFPIASFLGFVAVLIPLPWHLEAWNSGTCYYMFWVALSCLNQFVNSVTWANDAINRAPIWCDICKCDIFDAISTPPAYQIVRIATRIILAASVGIPASSLCIMRRLYSISKIHAVATSREDVRLHIPFQILRMTHLFQETSRCYHRFVDMYPLPNDLPGAWYVISSRLPLPLTSPCSIRRTRA